MLIACLKKLNGLETDKSLTNLCFITELSSQAGQLDENCSLEKRVFTLTLCNHRTDLQVTYEYRVSCLLSSGLRNKQ